MANPNLIGTSSQPGTAGVLGESSTFNGVVGSTTAVGQAGVAGISDTGNGVIGISKATGHSGVAGVHDQGGAGVGVYGRSRQEAGVYGESAESNGVLGVSKDNGVGVYGVSQNGEGLHGETNSKTLAAIGAFMLNPAGKGPAVHAENKGLGAGIYAKAKEGNFAGFFDGKVEVAGELTVQGQSLVQRINELEKLVQMLKKRLDLQQPLVERAAGGRISSVDVLDSHGRTKSYRVTGSGFRPNIDVTIRVATGSHRVKDFTAHVDGNGDLDHANFDLDSVDHPGPIYVAATDGSDCELDLTGHLWSNTRRTL